MAYGLAVQACCTVLTRTGAALFLSTAFSLVALAKPIRLQNGTFEPTAERATALVAPRQAPTNGLALIQFSGPLTDDSRQQLAAMGVDLLHYVPDDAFVANLQTADPQKVRQLGFVTWLGEYQPSYKVHRALLGAATNQVAQASSNDLVAVSILLAPRAPVIDTQNARALLAGVSQESHPRAGTVWRAQIQRSQLQLLASSRAVLWIEPAPRMRLFDEVASRIVAGDGPGHETATMALGYDGHGVTVAVADSGLDSGDTNAMHPDIQGRVRALFFYGAPGQLEDAADEHGHGTHCAGIIAGNGAVGETDENNYLYGLGVAPGASLIAQRIFDPAGGYAPPPSFEQLTRDAKRAGADVGSNSWGDDTQGQYDLSAMEFDELVRDADALAFGDQPYILEFSAGNAGPAYQTVGSPAVAKNVIATGASQNDRFNLPLEEFAIYADGHDAMTDFSSRGPCADGRIKPDVVAPGSWIASLRSVYANDSFSWMPISDSYMYEGGTSQAGPHASGAAAVFVHYWRSGHAGATPSPALTKAALINSATDMDDGVTTDAVPNNDEGWGRINLPALIGSSRNYDFTDQSVLLTNGGVFEKRILVGSSSEPFKVTLAYTDEPGLPAAVIALVNDLDLEVISPDGHVYRGNHFQDGDSVPDVPAADTINNVEAVHLLVPVPGEYLIRVRGSRIVEDARRETAPVDQDFALVVSGSFATPGTGLLTLNRAAYRVPDQIRIALTDSDLAGQATASVTVSSGAEPAGEVIQLHASGNSGTFTGVVATAIGPAAPNGKLEVADGNIVQATYADASPATNRVATALVDLSPPLISNVQPTNQFGQVAVAWTTDEPAIAEIYYGVPSPAASLTNTVLETSHEAVLLNVPANSEVKFYIVAQDYAGNRATNNNGGSFFSATNAQPPQLLLVDSFADYSVFGFLLAAAPPLAGYTDALDQLGVAYDVFDATTGAIPSLQQLNSYRCVIWRISDLEAPSTTLAQRVTTYVNSGGALFLASMEATTQFAGAGLTSFDTGVLNVQSYTADQSVDTISGTPGEPIGNGIDTTLDYAPYDDILQLAGTSDPSDWIVPNTNAAAIINSAGSIVGLRAPRTGVDLPGRVVFLSFPLDAVPIGSGIGNNRAGLLQNALNFLAPAPNTSTLTLDSDIYSVPGRAIVEVEDADQKGKGILSVNVHSPQHTNTVSLTLLETAHAGLFRGNVVFTPTNTTGPGTYFVNADDTIQFDYLDISANRTVTSTATIDTNAPVISGVIIEPGYLEAQVSWQTSKSADSLVQYSESPSFPINYTAYDPSPTTDHAAFLEGLKPNTKYYLRVTSRDRAGNTVTDDNHGTNYQFTTLLPLNPPWSDDLETNNVDWSTLASTDSEKDWAWGQPGNGEPAHSGSNCWGSNLDGGPVSQLEAYLFTPGIFLSGGNKATLHFWQNYDFTAQGDFDFQLAAIEIITNVATDPVLLTQMPESDSFGWVETELDLTPYMGNVVYVTWYHFLFSFDGAPRLGWLVDDVSITVTTIVPGTIQITNNLYQTVYALAGPSGLTGNGSWKLLTNAAPGEYSIQYGDVPYYNTPPPQTNTLIEHGTITFTGNYTFSDVNSNGIPDGWELAFLGNVLSNRTRLTDTDGDGQTDFEEFVAGTDPNNPPQPFRVSAQATNGGVWLAWPSLPSLRYQVLSAKTLPAAGWQVYSDWLPGTSSNVSLTIPRSTNGAPGFFRVAAASSSGIAGVFRLTAQRTGSGSFRLDWPTAPGHGYRVLGSTNLSAWQPYSDWIRASAFSSSLTLPNPTNGAPTLFRVEARP